MRIRIIYLSFILIFSGICVAQKNARNFTFKEVGWTIELPEGYNVVDSSVDAATQIKGQKAIEESNGVSLDMSDLKTLISASKSQFNYFSATITTFDPLEDGNYEENCQQAKDILYSTFTDQIPTAKIDSSTTSITIDGLRFDKFQLSIPLTSDITMTMVLLSRLQNNYDFGITYLYIDESTREEIENMLTNSKFKK